MSIKNKMLVIVPFLIILTVSILTVMSYRVVKQEMEKNINASMSTAVEKEANRIDAWIKEKRFLIKNLAATLGTVSFDKETHLFYMEKTRSIININGIFSGYEDKQYFDTNGWVPPNNEWDPRKRPWYSQAINAKKSQFLGPLSYKNSQGEMVYYIVIAHQILKNGTPFGVVASEIGTKEVSDIITKIKIMDSAYASLIRKEDGHVLFHPEKYYQGKTLNDLNLPSLAQEITTKKMGYTSFVQGDIEKIVYFKHLKEAPWVMTTIVSKSEVYAPLHALLQQFLIIGIIAIIIAIIIVYYSIQRSLLPLTQMKHHAIDLSSGDGDLTKTLKADKKDEISHVSKEINLFIHKIHTTIQDAKELSSENSTISHELSSTATQVGTRVETSTALITETMDISKTIQEEINHSVTEATNAKDEITKANTSLQQAQKDVLTMAHHVEESAKIEIDLAHKIEQLSHDAEQVKDVLTVINDIADQTNLLALNAAIEAARAGEHGRGFAVVADEVRQLAERTQRSLTEINATINVIVQSIADSSEQMGENSQKIQNLTTFTHNVKAKIDETSQVMEKTTQMTQMLTQNYIRTNSSIDLIVDKVVHINELSSENVRSVEEIASAAEHLNGMTEKLNITLNHFKT